MQIDKITIEDGMRMIFCEKLANCARLESNLSGGTAYRKREA